MVHLTDPPTPDAGVGDPLAALRVQHATEVAKLREIVSQLLLQIEFLQKKTDDAGAPQNRMPPLRETGQNPAIASFGTQQQQAGAEAHGGRQTEFLAMLAHELRNPLQPIAMANELLGKLGAVDPELPRLQAIIGRQVAHMARLVNDLLEASRVSSGKISLQKSELRLSDILDLARETCAPALAARHQQLLLLPAEPAWVFGDLIRLAQVLSNLILNASKFSPENETIIISSLVHGGSVSIVVSDRGMGISPELQPYIFDLFTQGVRSMERAQGGLGIGLSLVRALVEMHGGSVAVSSGGAGLGSEFTVVLPCSVQRPAKLPVVPVARRHGARCRILLVEDNLDASELLGRLLEQAGHQVVQRFDGVTAVASAQVQHFDVVLCDIGLPGLDGYQVIQHIRALPRTQRPYCIATTGYNQETDRQRAVDSGFDHYLVKPIRINDLLLLIEAQAPQPPAKT